MRTFPFPARLLAATSLLLPLRAHDPGLSSATVVASGDAITLRAAFANADARILLPALDRDGDGALGAAELDAGGEALAALAARWLHDGRPGLLDSARLDDNSDLVLEVRWPGGDAEGGTIEAALLQDLARGHRCYIAARGEAGVVRDALLTPQGCCFAVPAGLASAPARGFAQGLRFCALGVEHIWLGFDHLCFLLGLLITGGGLARAAATITAFSAAHSLTLAAAALGLCALPATLIEPAIAASIVWVAVDNLVGRPQRRWPLAFVFGLVHGFGFAGVLQDLDVGQGAIALPLFAFNLGVETGQLLIAAALLPLIACAQRRGHGPRMVRSGSLGIAVAGGWWLAERVGLW